MIYAIIYKQLKITLNQNVRSTSKKNDYNYYSLIFFLFVLRFWDSKNFPKFGSWVEKIPWRRKWLPSLIFVPGEFHGERRLVSYSHGVTNSQTWLSGEHFSTLWKRGRKITKMIFYEFLVSTFMCKQVTTTS